jgi:hypothetical protein
MSSGVSGCGGCCLRIELSGDLPAAVGLGAGDCISRGGGKNGRDGLAGGGGVDAAMAAEISDGVMHRATATDAESAGDRSGFVMIRRPSSSYSCSAAGSISAGSISAGTETQISGGGYAGFHIYSHHTQSGPGAGGLSMTDDAVFAC